ncbi:MAG: hypothetical protein WCL39_04820 [Armatimonadota bacterium]
MFDYITRPPQLDCIAVLAEGTFEPGFAKTATVIKRYVGITTVAIVYCQGR